MAELVHLRLEYTLPELEEMERVGLFSREEIHKIVKKRKDFEYKLRRKTKRKEDFLKYIEYEICLLSLISKRRERLLCESKKQEIDHKVAKRISRLFKGVISRFPDDKKLLLDQIQFCKKMKWYDNINLLYTQLVKIHSKDPSLWIMAAKWEMEESRSPENARRLLQRGVLSNPKSKSLWREYFRMELMYIDLIQKRREILQLQKIKDNNTKENDNVLSGKIPNAVYDKALEDIDDDVEFALSFIEICLEFDFCSKHIDYIFEKVSEKYPEKEETLDALAKRPLLDIETKIKNGKEQGIKKKTILENVNEEIFSKYEEAVNIVPTEKMWTFYIDCILNLMKSSKEKRKKMLQDKVVQIMEKAAALEYLNIDYYTEWTDLLFDRGDESEALSISLEAARKWNKANLWHKTIAYHIQCMQPGKKIYQFLLEAVNNVPEKESVILWKLGVEWLSAFYFEKLVEFFELGILKCKEISAPIKEMYLEATVVRNGVAATRELYKKFKKVGPLSHHIIRKMISIEKGQLNPSTDVLRKYYEDGIQEFGSSNVDIWLDYMKMEQDSGNAEKFSTLLWKAKKYLLPEHLEEFQTRLTNS